MRRLFAAAALTALLAAAAAAQEGQVGQTFTYELRDAAAFEAGYREHLRWHEVRRDPLVWYAWRVVSGERAGLFVDGTFGTTLAALEARIEPEADGADFRRTAGPFAIAREVETWLRSPGAGDAVFKEKRRPLDRNRVVLVTLRGGAGEAFAAALDDPACRARSPAPVSVYRRVEAPEAWLFVFPDEAAGGLSERLGAAWDCDAADIERTLAPLIKAERAETWAYEPRLSLFPGQPLVP